jgi:hypothetical protein
MENVDNDRDIGRGIDRINARFFDEAGNRASGLILDEIGESGHGLANRLWRVSAYLNQRAEHGYPVNKPEHSPHPCRIENVETDSDVI